MRVWAEVKKVAIAGVGFFADSYDLFVMNLLNVVLAAEFSEAVYTDKQKTTISSAALVGAIVGQLFFGVIADKLGRRLGLVLTSSLLIAGALASAVGFWPAPNEAATLFAVLAICRFVLGVGIGGEYPVAASVAAEYGDEAAPDEAEEAAEAAASRGRTVLLVFSMQGLGNLAATLVVLFTLLVFGTERGKLEPVWRISLGFGVVPVVCVLYSRLTMHESRLFEKQKQRKQEQQQQQQGIEEEEKEEDIPGVSPLSPGEAREQLSVAAPEPRKSGVSWKTTIRLYGLRLVGTAGSWLLWDIVWYSNSLFSSTLIRAIVPGAELIETAVCQLILVSVSIPGYFAAAFLVDKPWLGRRRLQIVGLVAIGALQCLVGLLYGKLKRSVPAFVMLYALVFFFAQFGPNSSTFLIPAEVFPTAIRARAHGISSAAGKAGAVIGAAMMLPLIDHFGGETSTAGPAAAFIACGLLSFLIIPFTFLVPETNRLPLSYEDDRFAAMLAKDQQQSETLPLSTRSPASL